MNDLNAWLKERRAIHDAATEGPWETGEVINWGDANDVPQVPVLSRNRAITWDDHGGEVFKPEDGNAIVDSHNTLPTLLTAVEKVLELHKPEETGVGDQYWKEPDYCPMCSEYYPCPTVRAIEGAIK